jgi:hypothetical protein
MGDVDTFPRIANRVPGKDHIVGPTEHCRIVEFAKGRIEDRDAAAVGDHQAIAIVKRATVDRSGKINPDKTDVVRIVDHHPGGMVGFLWTKHMADIDIFKHQVGNAGQFYRIEHGIIVGIGRPDRHLACRAYPRKGQIAILARRQQNGFAAARHAQYTHQFRRGGYCHCRHGSCSVTDHVPPRRQRLVQQRRFARRHNSPKW